MCNEIAYAKMYRHVSVHDCRGVIELPLLLYHRLMPWVLHFIYLQYYQRNIRIYPYGVRFTPTFDICIYLLYCVPFENYYRINVLHYEQYHQIELILYGNVIIVYRLIITI